MTTKLACALVALTLTLVACAQAEPVPETTTGTVGVISDGDTLRLANGSRVRLVQIDTPELGSECYARAARTALVRLAPVGSRVTLEADPALDRLDRNGRLLRYVFRGSTNVNLALVRAGAAAPYFFGGDRGRYAARLLSEAERAREARRGMWGVCRGTVLDPFRGIETGSP